MDTEKSFPRIIDVPKIVLATHYASSILLPSWLRESAMAKSIRPGRSSGNKLPPPGVVVMKCESVKVGSTLIDNLFEHGFLFSQVEAAVRGNNHKGTEVQLDAAVRAVLSHPNGHKHPESEVSIGRVEQLTRLMDRYDWKVQLYWNGRDPHGAHYCVECRPVEDRNGGREETQILRASEEEFFVSDVDAEF